VRGLWSGTGPSLLLVSNPTVQFFLYDLLKRTALRVRQRRAGGGVTALGPLDAFFLGAIAKAVATIVSYPLQVAQCRLRLQEDRPSLGSDAGPEVRCYDGTLDCLAKLWQAKGLKGWFQGIESKLLQVTMTTLSNEEEE
jgi:adenine nucleotide transporter 17